MQNSIAYPILGADTGFRKRASRLTLSSRVCDALTCTRTTSFPLLSEILDVPYLKY